MSQNRVSPKKSESSTTLARCMSVLGESVVVYYRRHGRAKAGGGDAPPSRETNREVPPEIRVFHKVSFFLLRRY